MLENVNYSTNNNISKDDSRINTSDFVKQPSFKGNPNAVDKTPTADTYYPRPTEELPEEMGMGAKYLRYGIPTGVGLYYSTKLFDRANKGDYEKSLVGRLGKLGDKIAQSPVIKNNFVHRMKNHGSVIKRNIQSFIDRHETLSAMQKTPTKPECKLVTGFLETQGEADIKEAGSKLFKYIDEGPKSLKDLGATKAEIQALKAKYGTTMFGKIKNLQAALRELEISRMGFDPASIPAGEPMKNVRLSHLGISLSGYDKIKGSPEIYARQIEQALETSKGVSPKLSTYFNKLKSASAPATKLGRFLPKAAKLGMRGLTFGGGLFNCLFFLGFFLADAVKNTIDAPDDKKVSTGVHGFFDAISWVVAMPIALKAMHAINGLKNLGKTEAEVKAYETAYNAFKQRANARAFTSKAEYDTAWQAVENLKNAGKKPTGIKWVLSKLASFTSIGLGQKPAYKEKAEGMGFLGRNIKNWIKKDNLTKVFGNIKRGSRLLPKNIIGYPLRFALYMFAFQPIVDKIFGAPLTAMFGKPYDPEKIREEHEKYNQHVEELRAMRGPSIQRLYGPQDPNAVTGLDYANENNLSDDNLLKQKLTEMNALPPKQANTPVQQGVGYEPNQPQVVNGVQITTTTDGKPYMPGDNNHPNGQVNGQGLNPNDPNVSDYDNVPRSYIPQLTSMDIPYPDPYADPAMEKNYNEMNNLYAKMDKAEQDALDVINDKRKL